MDYIDLIGKPFLAGGRGPDGYDCYGLAKEIYKRRGIELPEYDYDSPDNFSLIHHLIHGGRDLFETIERPEAFCLVLFTIRPPYVSHIGVVLEDCNSFIHVVEKVCAAVEKLEHPIWERRVRGFLRWKN